MIHYKVMYFSYLMLNSERAKFHFKIGGVWNQGVREWQLELEVIVVVSSQWSLKPLLLILLHLFEYLGCLQLSLSN